MIIKSVAVVAFVLVLSACGKKDEPNPSPAMSASMAPSAMMAPSASASTAMMASATPMASAMAARGVPSQADEAVLAAKEIDKSNYKKELDALDKDLK